MNHTLWDLRSMGFPRLAACKSRDNNSFPVYRLHSRIEVSFFDGLCRGEIEES